MASIGNSIIIRQKERIVILGKEVIPFHEKMTGRSITTINGKSYIDGFELVDGKWKRTFTALWYKIF